MHHKQDIKVSVCIVAYNHEAYLAQCLESLLNQSVAFKFEIIIGEDCSSDSTREILKDYARLYPDIIVPIYHEKNVGAVENIKSVYRKAKGKYIYHLDGDDLALGNKLQRQYDILEQNSDCELCSHNMRYIDADRKNIGEWKHEEGKFDLDYLYEHLPFFAHSSKMFRNDFKFDYFDDLHPQALDIEIHVEQARKGLIYHIGEELGMYRVEVGVSMIGKKINPILPKGVMRVYDRKLAEENDSDKLEKLKKTYAKGMLQYARQFYKTGSDYGVYCELVEKSLSIKFYTLRQFFYLSLTILPKIVYLKLGKK